MEKEHEKSNKKQKVQDMLSKQIQDREKIRADKKRTERLEDMTALVKAAEVLAEEHQEL